MTEGHNETLGGFVTTEAKIHLKNRLFKPDDHCQ